MSNENKYEFKGTPQKWIGGGYANGCHFVCAYDDENSRQIPIAYVEKPIHDTVILTKEQSEANLKLIAAAPELLQACIVLQQTLEPLVNNPVHEDLMNQLKQAIHKALNITK